MEQVIERVLIDRRAIAGRVEEMAGQIAADFRAHAASNGEPPALVLVPIMTGSIIFLADLIRELPLMLRLNVISVNSYTGKATVGGELTISGNLPEDMSGAHVLIVDDILDSGRTLTAIRGMIAQRGVASVGTCVLLRKRIPSAMATPAEYVGFDIEDRFVVGYGLDYDGYYRNLPDVVTLKQEAMR